MKRGGKGKAPRGREETMGRTVKRAKGNLTVTSK